MQKKYLFLAALFSCACSNIFSMHDNQGSWTRQQIMNFKLLGNTNDAAELEKWREKETKEYSEQKRNKEQKLEQYKKFVHELKIFIKEEQQTSEIEATKNLLTYIKMMIRQCNVNSDSESESSDEDNEKEITEEINSESCKKLDLEKILEDEIDSLNKDIKADTEENITTFNDTLKNMVGDLNNNFLSVMHEMCKNITPQQQEQGTKILQEMKEIMNPQENIEVISENLNTFMKKNFPRYFKNNDKS